MVLCSANHVVEVLNYIVHYLHGEWIEKSSLGMSCYSSCILTLAHLWVDHVTYSV